jgi:two-component system nitrogen regulation sensor histidine kinase NtrY
VHRLESRLIAVFLAATAAPLLITLWLSVSLLDRSLALSPTKELDETTKALRDTGHAYYLQTCAALKRDAEAGRAVPARYAGATASDWPEAWREFWSSRDRERFLLDSASNRVLYLARSGHGLLVYSAPLGEVHLGELTSLYSRARAILDASLARNLRRGFALTLLLLAASIWVLSFAFLVYWAHRLSRPIQSLTAGLAEVAAGRLNYRVPETGRDEMGAAIRAFNEMAAQLEQSRERLVAMTRLESWQALARKTAHEIKNSLTPIRLTMEELAARAGGRDAEFLRQASQIVVDEVTGLERRVRAFSELASEPPFCPKELDVNTLLEERISLLKAAHPAVDYRIEAAESLPPALADEDLLKGALTNLLENAAEAVEPEGEILALTQAGGGQLWIEIHDSGPGLEPHALQTLFEPSISFKNGGMGLGLSIARKSALRMGGDIACIPGRLGGAGFRVVLPVSGTRS